MPKHASLFAAFFLVLGVSGCDDGRSEPTDAAVDEMGADSVASDVAADAPDVAADAGRDTASPEDVASADSSATDTLAGSDTRATLDTVPELPTDPCADWPQWDEVQPSCGPAPLTVTFAGAGMLAQFETGYGVDWDFGDGSTSSQTDTTHTYTAVGDYLASATVSGNVGGTDMTVTFSNLSVRVHAP